MDDTVCGNFSPNAVRHAIGQDHDVRAERLRGGVTLAAKQLAILEALDPSPRRQFQGSGEVHDDDGCSWGGATPWLFWMLSETV